MKYALLLFALFPFFEGFAQFEERDNRMYNEFIVMLKPTAEIGALQQEFPTLKPKQCLSRRMNIWLLERNTVLGGEELLSLLRRNSQVALAQFNHSGIEERSIVPDDTYFNLQWALQNSGAGGGVPGADIDAPEAWAIHHGNRNTYGDTIVVAVIDGKPFLAHDDLNFFTNYGEVPANGIDDDGNGYLDDVNGWNVADTSGNIDGNDSHSTHIAGVIGAKTDNQNGIAGVCWGVKILPVNYGSTVESNVVAAYDYAREMRILYDNTFGAKGAYVVAANSSFGIDGGQFGAHHADYPIWCAMYDSMGAVGILSIGATANKGWNVDVNDDMPTGCPSKWLIAVTNTTNKDLRNTGAAFGKASVDLGAPGTGIYATLSNNNYGNMTGTSMAAPHVAGAVAAMYAAACKGFIDFSFEQPDSAALLIKQYLLDGAEWISSLNNTTGTNGRLNLYRAIRNLERFNCDSCSFALSLAKTPNSCYGTDNGTLAVQISDSLSSYNLLWSNGQTTQLCSALAPGFYSVQVSDSSGCLRTATAELHYPDSIVINHINIIAPTESAPGNITIQASAGNDTLFYSLDNIQYQQSATFSIPTEGGNEYTVYVKNKEGCRAQQAVFINSASALAVPPVHLHVYPNPATALLHVKWEAAAAPLHWCIFNTIGQAVWQSENTGAQSSADVSVPTSGWEPGLYLLQLTTEQGVATHRFVVAAP